MTLPVRTVPPYVRSVSWDDEPTAPSEGHVNRERPKLFYIPDLRPLSEQPGHKFDHLHSRTPPIITRPTSELLSYWRSFASPTFAPEGSANRKRIEERPSFSDRLLRWPPSEDEVAESKQHNFDVAHRSFWHKRKETLLKTPFVPLCFRLLNLAFSTTCLGIAAYTLSDSQCFQQASTYLTVVFNALGIPYILWTTYDEFTSAPIGLRQPADKLRVVLLDLAFITLESANISLAFSALTDKSWVCYSSGAEACPDSVNVCNRQKGLAALGLAALLAWLGSLIVNLIRLVWRLERD